MATVRDTIALGSRVEAHRPYPRVVVTEEQWRSIAAELAAGHATLLDLWGEPDVVHMAVLLEPVEVAVVTVECAERQFPSVGALHAPAIRLERAIQDLYGLKPRARWTTGRGSISDSGMCSTRWATAPHRSHARPTGSCRPKAKACTRSQWGPCTPASSSLAISASPPMARPWCVSSNAWATCTRASIR